MRTMLMIAVWCMLGVGVVRAAETVVLLSVEDIVSVVPEGEAMATVPQVVTFALPEGLATVRQAWLEMRVDVSVREVGGFRDPAPLFEVYALSADVTGAIQPKMFREMLAPMSRPVAVGENRLVRIDITEFVRLILDDPESNHGVAFGAVTADTRGVFAVRADGLGPGAAARVRIVE